jgi:hypothetical protein
MSGLSKALELLHFPNSIRLAVLPARNSMFLVAKASRTSALFCRERIQKIALRRKSYRAFRKITCAGGEPVG